MRERIIKKIASLGIEDAIEVYEDLKVADSQFFSLYVYNIGLTYDEENYVRFGDTERNLSLSEFFKGMKQILDKGLFYSEFELRKLHFQFNYLKAWDRDVESADDSICEFEDLLCDAVYWGKRCQPEHAYACIWRAYEMKDQIKKILKR